LYNHWRKNHPRDPNNNPKKVVTDVMAGEAVQRNHQGRVPDPADDDDLENVPDTSSADDSERGSCLEVLGDEEWVSDYRDD
jgi:hypothetical protein